MNTNDHNDNVDDIVTHRTVVAQPLAPRLDDLGPDTDDDGEDDDIDDIKERGTHLVCCLGQRQNKTTACYLIPTYSYCPLSHMVVWFPVSCLTKNSHQQITL